MRLLFLLLLFPSFLSAQATMVIENLIKGIPGNESFNVMKDNRLAYRTDDVNFGIELWVTDGTVSGTTLVSDLNPGVNSSSPNRVFPTQNYLYYIATSDSLRALFRTSNSDFTTKKIENLTTSPGQSSPALLYYELNGMVVVYYFPPSQAQKISIVDSDGSLQNLFSCQPCQFSTGLTVVDNNLYFQGSPGQIWTSNGTVAGTKHFSTISNEPFGFSEKDAETVLILATRSSDSTFFTYNLHKTTGATEALDSVKVDVSASVLRRASITEINGEIFLIYGRSIAKITQSTGKISIEPSGGEAYVNSAIQKCGDRIFYYVKNSDGFASLMEYKAPPQNPLLLFSRTYSHIPESPQCFGSTLLGEWSKAIDQNGVFVLHNGIDSLYFESGSSWSARVVGNTLYWIGDGSDGNYGSLWKLDLTTVNTQEPLPNQLDISVYPTLSQDGTFYLGGSSSQNQLMSAHLLNQEGKFVHVITRPAIGQPLQFGNKAPGVYYLYLVDMKGKTTIQKVIFQ